MQPTAVQEQQAADTPRATAANTEDSQDEAREARETLKKEWDEAVRKTKPKDTAAGLKSGVATAAAGVASGIVGLFAAPIVGAKQEGASGFAKGLATGKQGCAVGPGAGVSICSACAGPWGSYQPAGVNHLGDPDREEGCCKADGACHATSHGQHLHRCHQASARVSVLQALLVWLCCQ